MQCTNQAYNNASWVIRILMYVLEVYTLLNLVLAIKLWLCSGKCCILEIIVQGYLSVCKVENAIWKILNTHLLMLHFSLLIQFPSVTTTSYGIVFFWFAFLSPLNISFSEICLNMFLKEIHNILDHHSLMGGEYCRLHQLELSVLLSTCLRSYYECIYMG